MWRTRNGRGGSVQRVEALAAMLWPEYRANKRTEKRSAGAAVGGRQHARAERRWGRGGGMRQSDEVRGCGLPSRRRFARKGETAAPPAQHRASTTATHQPRAAALPFCTAALLSPSLQRPRLGFCQCQCQCTAPISCVADIVSCPPVRLSVSLHAARLAACSPAAASSHPRPSLPLHRSLTPSVAYKERLRTRSHAQST